MLCEIYPPHPKIVPTALLFTGYKLLIQPEKIVLYGVGRSRYMFVTCTTAGRASSYLRQWEKQIHNDNAATRLTFYIFHYSGEVPD